MIHLSIKEEDELFKVLATKKSSRLEDEVKIISIKQTRDDAEALVHGLLKDGKADTAEIGSLLLL